MLISRGVVTLFFQEDALSPGLEDEPEDPDEDEVSEFGRTMRWPWWKQKYRSIRTFDDSHKTNLIISRYF